MNEQWKHAVITDVRLAMYVEPNTGKTVHKDRPFHGFVLNDAGGVKKTYLFDDGRVLETEQNSLFYLPKGSSYLFRSLQDGGCYAINFETEIADLPFSVPVRNAEPLRHLFRRAADAWKRKDEMRLPLAMQAIYASICEAQKESQRAYVSGAQRSLLLPAIEKIERDFYKREISVAELAELCGISEVYFRRLFVPLFGVAPKEYIIQKRIEYAKSLLSAESFEVSEVARLCGYEEPCHFSREFSRRVGVAPSLYGKQ